MQQLEQSRPIRRFRDLFPEANDKFAMTIRAYASREELINGLWSSPSVKIGKGEHPDLS